MIFRRVLATTIAGFALVACAGCALWLLGAAVYLLFAPLIGAAGAAASLAFIVAVVLAVAGAVAATALGPKAPQPRQAPATARDSAARVVAFVRARPVTALSAAALTAAAAATSPRLLLLALRALIPRHRSAA